EQIRQESGIDRDRLAPQKELMLAGGCHGEEEMMSGVLPGVQTGRQGDVGHAKGAKDCFGQIQAASIDVGLSAAVFDLAGEDRQQPLIVHVALPGANLMPRHPNENCSYFKGASAAALDPAYRTVYRMCGTYL